jgi:hypothetical protein
VTDRRDFMKLLGTALGTAFLTGCGSGSEDELLGLAPGTSLSSPLPNGYRFQPVVQTGSALPGGSTVSGDPNKLPFPGGLILHDSGQLWVHARDQQGRLGMYRYDDIFEQRKIPEPASGRLLVRNGDPLPGGSTVKRFALGDANQDGTYATAISAENKKQAIFFHRGSGLERVLGQFTPLQAFGGEISGHFGQTISIHDNEDLLFVAHYTHTGRGQKNGQALFFSENARVDSTLPVVVQGDVLPGSTWTVASFGIGVLHDQRGYIVQGTAQPAGLRSRTHTRSRNRMHETFVLRGRVGEPFQLVEAHEQVGKHVPNGSTIMGPRLGPGGRHITICHLDQDRTEVRLNGQKLLTADSARGGDPSPLGHPILSFLPPSTAEGLAYFQVFTTAGMELVVTNGTNWRTLLSRGDVLSGKTINTLMFGALPRQATRRGHLAGVVEFTDKTHAVLVGSPV